VKSTPFLFFITVILFFTSVIFLGCTTNTSSINNPVDNIVRLHIRANSNSRSDQAVKYEVRDAVLLHVEAILVDSVSKPSALVVLRRESSALERIANQVLASNGHIYSAVASVGVTHFPTVRYPNFTLGSGYYSALVIKLGNANGRNWWCVLYPPLCYTPRGDSESGRFEYRSFLWDNIINR